MLIDGLSSSPRLERAIEAGKDMEQKQSYIDKITMGLSVFLILVVILWFPLFLLSSANPTNRPNLVTTISVQIGIPGWSPFYHMDQNQELVVVSSALFSNLSQTFSDLVQDDRPNTQLTGLFSVRWQPASIEGGRIARAHLLVVGVVFGSALAINTAKLLPTNDAAGPSVQQLDYGNTRSSIRVYSVRSCVRL